MVQILPELVLQVVDLPVHPLVGLHIVVELALGLREGRGEGGVMRCSEVERGCSEVEKRCSEV